ncbi:12643_t:CDS:2 [Funneliformis geosporum]|uniref:15604_t:CDS:1 n=1 Tax=Funneliformis geosporum TaxID=1117311 RepID=A0A9W4SS07_9GLOM|nr:15604_t:CDS:2 [Funneliformis geosporum]CAI2182810.1 12643_t:CDS:2 [Funneliformis geosporum]
MAMLFTQHGECMERTTETEMQVESTDTVKWLKFAFKGSKKRDQIDESTWINLVNDKSNLLIIQKEQGMCSGVKEQKAIHDIFRGFSRIYRAIPRNEKVIFLVDKFARMTLDDIHTLVAYKRLRNSGSQFLLDAR